MVSGAMLANLAVTPTIVITEHEAELFTRLLASDRRIEELESERNRLLEEKAGMAGRIEQLERQVEELTRKTGLNSTNSSKPPSSDGLRRKPRPTSPERKRRKEQGRRPGKQKGAPGARLAPVAVPDRVEELLPSHCGKCVASLAGASPAEGRPETRQTADLPPPPGLIWTEYRAFTLVCPDCGAETKATFPQWAKAPASYGPRLHAMTNYLGVWQHVPYLRMGRLLHDVYGVDIPPGWRGDQGAEGGGRAFGDRGPRPLVVVLGRGAAQGERARALQRASPARADGRSRLLRAALVGPDDGTAAGDAGRPQPGHGPGAGGARSGSAG